MTSQLFFPSRLYISAVLLWPAFYGDGTHNYSSHGMGDMKCTALIHLITHISAWTKYSANSSVHKKFSVTRHWHSECVGYEGVGLVCVRGQIFHHFEGNIMDIFTYFHIFMGMTSDLCNSLSGGMWQTAMPTARSTWERASCLSSGSRVPRTWLPHLPLSPMPPLGLLLKSWHPASISHQMWTQYRLLGQQLCPNYTHLQPGKATHSEFKIIISDCVTVCLCSKIIIN